MKNNQDTTKLINKIKKRNYSKILKNYNVNKLILVAINCKRDTESNSPHFKHYQCKIEKINFNNNN